MKKLIALVVLAATVAIAADDYQPGKDITTGAASACVAVSPKTSYSVRCTQDAYVKATYDGTVDPATSKDVLVTAGKLFDVPTKANQGFICAIQSTAAGACYLYIFGGKAD
jgi:hypothetical protein